TGNLSSFAYDYVARQKVGGTTLAGYILECAPYEKSVTFGLGMGEGIRLLVKERSACSTRARWIAVRSLAPSSWPPPTPPATEHPSSCRTSWRHRATLVTNRWRCPALIPGRSCHSSSGVGPDGPRGRAVAL